MNGEIHETVSFIDPMVVPFSRSHLPVVFLSALILFLILLPPTLLLLFYPTACFRRLSKRLKPRQALAMKIFTDVFYGTLTALNIIVDGVFSPHIYSGL